MFVLKTNLGGESAGEKLFLFMVGAFKEILIVAALIKYLT